MKVTAKFSLKYPQLTNRFPYPIFCLIGLIRLKTDMGLYENRKFVVQL